MKVHPNEKLKMSIIDPISSEYIKMIIDDLRVVGVLSKTDHIKLMKKFDSWLLKYGLKWQETPLKQQ